MSATETVLDQEPMVQNNHQVVTEEAIASVI